MTRDAKKFLICVAAGIAALILISLLGALFGFGGSSAVGEAKTYEITEGIKSLEVEIGAADFRIEIAEKFSVESNLKKLNLRQTGDRLIIGEKSFGNKNYNGAFIVVYIPEGIVFTELDITTGAGKFTAQSLSSEKIDFEFGAGEVNITELNATREADIEGGAGKITIGGGSLSNLNFDMGVGELNLTSAIVGDGELDLGVGEANITLIGSRDDYTVEMTKGIGSLRFDGESLSRGKVVGNGKNNVEINGGVGSIEVAFK